ncbi:hypothetical protein F4805DRAFT_472886 [Annulohypoxylon moriforme]|nr:hypothetical protein F4805DRAFT_472886 [Annulohypoxylon moriforme]
MASLFKNHVTRFKAKLRRSRSSTLRPGGYEGIPSNLGLYEIRGPYCIGLETYQMVHLERYLFIYGKPQYVFENTPLVAFMESDNVASRQASKWYTLLRDIASGRSQSDMADMSRHDQPTNSMVRDWSYLVDHDATDNTLKLLDYYTAWDDTDNSIIGDNEDTPNVLVTRRIAIEDHIKAESRIPHALSELVPHIRLAIKTFLEIEFGILDYDSAEELRSSVG